MFQSLQALFKTVHFETKFGHLLSHHVMKLNQNLAILFWLYTNKTDSQNNAPVYCRITLDGNRTQFSTGKKINLLKWEGRDSKAFRSDQEVIELKEDLETIKGDLRRLYNQLTATHQMVTGEMIKNAFTGKGQEKKTIIQLFDAFIAMYKQKVDQKKAAYRTLQKFYTLKFKMVGFLKKEFSLSDKPLCELKASFGHNLKHYFSVNEHLSENTAMIYIRKIKQILEFAVMRDWIKKNPLKEFKCAYKNPFRETLTMDEIICLRDFDFAERHLSETRDIFIFSCFTGYAYQEVYELSPDCIVTGMDKNKWVVKIRQKTDEKEMVPLLPIALDLIEKYKADPRCIAKNKILPVHTNQAYNRELKNVAKAAGIKKHLTTHIARHTFATTVTLENDVPIESVSKMLGHRSIRTTQIYAKVSLKKLSNNMNELRSKLFPVTASAETGS